MFEKKKNILLNSKNIIWAIIIFALILRVGALVKYGLKLTLDSDDQGYIRSAITLLNKGMLTYHDVNEPTVHIMPGQPFFLAFIFLIFGSGVLGLYAAKMFTIFLGVAGIYGIYLIGKYVWSVEVGLIGAFILTISPTQILTDNLLLTETPFMTASIFLIYYSIRLANEKKQLHFYLVVFLFLAALMFRPTVALYPVILLIYLIFRKYPFKLMIRQLIPAALICLIIMMPWWIRNYYHFHEFIPLSGGAGNPLLLGTYQGVGYPNNETLDQVFERLENEYTRPDKYSRFKQQEYVAKERMKEWWNKDKSSFIYSYGIVKPRILWETPFYWLQIYHVDYGTIAKVHKKVLLIGIIGLLASILMYYRKKSETFLIILFLLYFTVLNSIYFAYDRYNQTLMPFIFLGVGCILGFIIKKIKAII